MSVMNDVLFSGAPQRSGRYLFRRIGPVLMSVIAVGLLAAACGGSAAPSGVASIGSTTSTTSAPTSSSAQLDKYGACMRSNGLPDYQNPIVNGNTITMQVGTPGALANSPRYLNAQLACRFLLPKGLRSPQNKVTPADQADYLKAVACVHSHDYPEVPDPTFAGGTVKIVPPPSIDQSSPQFEKALATCRKLIPAGLPYSN